MLARRLLMVARGIAVAARSHATGAASSQLAIPKPAGVGEGALLVAFVVESAYSRTVTVPAGWTELAQVDGRSLAYKVAGPSEPASYTWTFGSAADSQGDILAISGGRFDVAGSFGAAFASVTAAAVTAAADNSLALAWFAATETPNTTFSTPSGWTSVTSDSASNITSAAIFSKAVSAGSTGDAVSTTSPSKGSRGIQLVIRPK